jgi:hypothetical protein
VTERLVFRFGAAAACLSLVVFALCAAGVARTPWLVLSAAAVAALATRMPWPRLAVTPPLGRDWKILFWVIAIPFALVYIVYAAAPEISPDGSYYHLGLVRRYLDHGGFYRITTNLFANFPQGCEMLFLVAYAIGRHSAAALVHCAYLLALPAALIAFGRRFQIQTAGIIAALLVFVSPVAGIDGSTAYVDVALAFTGFACFYALEVSTAPAMLLLAGLLAGFSFAIKYTGVVAILYAAAFVLLRTRSLRALAFLLAPAALVAVPWLVKNWIVVDNPLSPFFNRLFPNPYVDPGFEDTLGGMMRHLNGHHLGWQTPLELTLRGGLLQGTLGPAFLLAPVGLLALTDPLGRRILAAAALFALPWFSNIGTRFLLPALPFIALSMGMALARWPRAAVAVVALNAIFCWPWVLGTYCAGANWRLDRFPLRAALRLESARDYETRYAPWIDDAFLLQEKVPPGGVVYTAQPVMTSYTDREILLNYASAPNTRIEDTLHAAIQPELQPSTRVSFRFDPQSTRTLRVVAAAAPMWTIHEFETPVAKLSASLNRWDAGLAADGNLATSWRSWQPVPSGAYFEFAPANSNGIFSFRTRPADPLPPLRLETQLPSGTWQTLGSVPQIERGLPVSDLRGEAVAELRRRGVTHLFIHDQEALGPDIRAHLGEWQVRLTGTLPPMRLYEILPAKSIDTARELRNNTR